MRHDAPDLTSQASSQAPWDAVSRHRLLIAAASESIGAAVLFLILGGPIALVGIAAALGLLSNPRVVRKVAIVVSAVFSLCISAFGLIFLLYIALTLVDGVEPLTFADLTAMVGFVVLSAAGIVTLWALREARISIPITL